jgi:hypothetical protein
MAGNQREARLALLEIGQLRGEQLDVSAADARPAHVHDQLPRAGDRRVHVLNRSRLRPVDHQRAHIGHRIGTGLAEWLITARGSDRSCCDTRMRLG